MAHAGLRRGHTGLVGRLPLEACTAASRADHRRNTLAYLGDHLFFGVGMSFASQATVLPSLVRELSDSALLVGLVSAIATGGG
jgi:hypothetical protein